MSESGVPKAFGGTAAVGHCLMVSDAESSAVPTARSRDATTMPCVGMRLSRRVLSSTRQTPKVAAAAVTRAAVKTKVKRRSAIVTAGRRRRDDVTWLRRRRHLPPEDGGLRDERRGGEARENGINGCTCNRSD
jgi:hypothetical protein